MPLCKACKRRIDLSQPNVYVNVCRKCRKTYCDLHFDKSKQLCCFCLGVKPEEMEAKKGAKLYFIRR